jgi:hypothetical protein
LLYKMIHRMGNRRPCGMAPFVFFVPSWFNFSSSDAA